MDPATISTIAGLALSMIPDLMRLTGFESIKDFMDYMGELKEKGLMPTEDEIKDMIFSDTSNFITIDESNPAKARALAKQDETIELMELLLAKLKELR